MTETDKQISDSRFRDDAEDAARAERETAGKDKCKGGCDDYFDPKMLEDGLCPDCKKWADDEYRDNLIEIIGQVKISHEWMLATIKMKADELNPGNYSDDLKHAIAVQEKLLESVV